MNIIKKITFKSASIIIEKREEFLFCSDEPKILYVIKVCSTKSGLSNCTASQVDGSIYDEWKSTSISILKNRLKKSLE